MCVCVCCTTQCEYNINFFIARHAGDDDTQGRHESQPRLFFFPFEAGAEAFGDAGIPAATSAVAPAASGFAADPTDSSLGSVTSPTTGDPASCPLPPGETVGAIALGDGASFGVGASLGWIGVAPSAEDDGGLLLAALLCPAAPESPARLGAGSTDSPSERADLPSPASVSGVHGSEPKVMLGSDLFLWCPGLLWYLPPTPSSVLDAELTPLPPCFWPDLVPNSLIRFLPMGLFPSAALDCGVAAKDREPTLGVHCSSCETSFTSLASCSASAIIDAREISTDFAFAALASSRAKLDLEALTAAAVLGCEREEEAASLGEWAVPAPFSSLGVGPSRSSRLRLTSEAPEGAGEGLFSPLLWDRRILSRPPSPTGDGLFSLCCPAPARPP